MQETPVQFRVEKIHWRSIGYPLQYSWASLMAQLVKIWPTLQETLVQSLGWEDPLGKETATQSSILAWSIHGPNSPWGHKESDTTEQLSLLTFNPLSSAVEDVFKKIRVTKGNFHAKMGTMKDKNDKNLTEAEEIKKRLQEYTEVKWSCSVVSDSLRPCGL